ncbi:MAG: hypothetical protein QXN71_02665 [Candidatus Aenigmatarchaeota archaeon]
MKISAVLALAVVFIGFFLPLGKSIETPEVTFIPEQISVNSSFLMIADPKALPGEIVAVSWIIPGIENAYGSFPKVGNKWVCYFSNTDPLATCGYNRFPYPSPYTVLVDATTYGQVENKSVNITIGGIPITTEIASSGTNVYMKAWAGGPVSTPISYKVYSSESFEIIKTGTMTYNPNIYGYTSNITLQNGEYYIAFTANSSTDFGGGVARVVVGGGTTPISKDISAESIIHNPVINPGQIYTLRKFKLTNIGTQNITALSITVPQELLSILTINPEKTSLEHNESTIMVVTLKNIQNSLNISTYATLFSGSEQILQIPVELRVTVIGAVDPSSCLGKDDGSLCLGGICCGEICRVKAECCLSSDCPSGKVCTDFKCVTSITPSECEGKPDMSTCTDGICCSGACIQGGECCVSSDCPSGKTCSYNNKCISSVTPGECEGKTDGTTCSTGVCCSGECVECCKNDDCKQGEVCSTLNKCEPSSTDGGGGIDVLTIALIAGGVAAAVFAGFFIFKKFIKKKGEGEEEVETEEEEFSDEDFY